MGSCLGILNDCGFLRRSRSEQTPLVGGSANSRFVQNSGGRTENIPETFDLPEHHGMRTSPIQDVYEEANQLAFTRFLASQSGMPASREIGVTSGNQSNLVEAKGESTKAIVGSLKDKASIEKTVDDLRGRARARNLEPNMLIRYLDAGKRSGPLIGDFTRAFTAERYAQKHDLQVVFYSAKANKALDGTYGTLPDDQSLKIKEKLSKNQCASLVLCKENHSVPVSIGANERVMSAVVLDSTGPKDIDANRKIVGQALSGLAKEMGRTLSVKSDLSGTHRADTTGPGELSFPGTRQSDSSSCHTDALVLLKHIAVNEPNFAEAFEDGGTLPSTLLRTSQRPAFIASNDYQGSTIYSGAKNRTVDFHRAEHTVSEGEGAGRHLFLHAKSLQFAEAAMTWVTKFEDPDEALQAVEAMVKQHFGPHSFEKCGPPTRSRAASK